MDKKELDLIIQKGEGQTIEFKENVDKSLSKEIVAFTNAQGGKIFIGITDKGEIKKLNNLNRLSSQITDIAKKCDPSIKIRLETSNDILVVDVEEGNNKPYSCSNGFYLRVGANSQKLSRDEILEFSIMEGKIYFDGQINEEFRFPDDFDENKLKKYLDETKLSKKADMKSILINLGVAKEYGDTIIFNNAGVLFFAKEPSRFFMTSKVICAEYATNDKVTILDRKIYDDGILNNLTETINFIRKKIKIRFKIDTVRREEIPQFPETAFREAIVNAIMHRDYFDKSSDVMIENYRNKIVIYNPGGLVRWLKPDEFGKISKTRNPIIASLLSRTIFVEKMGTGIKRIMHSMKDDKLPEPQFEYYEHSFYVTLKDNELCAGVNEGLSEGLNEGLKTLLDIIKRNPGIKAKNCSEQLNKRPIKTIERQIKILIEKGLIERRGSKKTGGYWMVV